MSLEPIELKFLLKLLGYEDYRGKISAIKPNSKTKAPERNKVCKGLMSKGLVETESDVARFTIAPPGRTLLSLDTTSLPVTPDELIVLKDCKGSMTPGKLRKIPADSRQQMIRDLAERGMLKITDTTITEVWLSAQGKQFLRDEYEPKGNSLVATATMLGHYINFLRQNSGAAASRQRLPTHQPEPQRPLSQAGGMPNSTMPIGSGAKPDAQAVLRQIKQLDQLLGADNYLPIYPLREKLQSLLTREELDDRLYELQRNDQIELSSLHDQGDYSDSQVSAGIPQNHGRSLFFITVI